VVAENPFYQTRFLVSRYAEIAFAAPDPAGGDYSAAQNTQAGKGGGEYKSKWRTFVSKNVKSGQLILRKIIETVPTRC